ncbi:translin-associated protein X [Macrobrachium rosenbergii]|uniref:translin-associated protein X n=1 Tax=Macrobrachium rosenbergii TaxID=79674 RepID=UPI0034D6EED3
MSRTTEEGSEKQRKHLASDTSQDTPLMTLFRDYSRTLVDKNDKYERVYKTSRDITVRSKRIIFSLQRIPGLDGDEREKILSSAASDLREIEQTQMKYIAQELVDEEPYQFVYAYTGGLQEYIEALSLHHFLTTDKIIGHSDIQERLSFGSSEEDNDVVPMSVLVQPKEYILGIADLTGELMRFCIKCVSTGDFEVCYRICDVLKRIHGGFLSLGYIPLRELYYKFTVFRSSLHKVEEACYSLQLRKSEVPAEMLGDVFAMYDADESHQEFI